MGAYPVGFEGKISIGALDIFNGGVKNPMGVLKRVNGGTEKIRRGYCVGSIGALGAWRKGQWRRWSGSMEALVRVKGGIEKGQWALVRVNGGIEQWGLNGGIEKDQWGGHWSGSMGVLKRVNGGVGQGQWGHGEGSGQTGDWLWVRQGCGCGSDKTEDRRLS